MPSSPAYSAALILLLACNGLAHGQDPPNANVTGTTDLPPGVRWLRDLKYVPGGHQRQKLDLYLPKKASGPLPVIVWVHGGGWKDGDKDWRRAVPLVPKGYAVANIDYPTRAAIACQPHLSNTRPPGRLTIAVPTGSKHPGHRPAIDHQHGPRDVAARLAGQRRGQRPCRGVHAHLR